MTLSFMNSAPTPFGPWNLWLLMDIMSIPIRFGYITYLPNACMASTWKSTLGFFSFIRLAMSSTGMTAPISLLTYMTDTMIVSSSTSSTNRSTSTTPSFPVGILTTSNPISSRNVSGLPTEACSTAVVMILLPALLLASAPPIRAMLLDSVPPDVNTISFA